MVFAPDDAALRTLTWVWPPALLALVVWMSVQMRRHLTGRGRWLLTPGAGRAGRMQRRRPSPRTSASTRDRGAPIPAPGRTYAVGDHRLHLDCRGQGGPTVVLFNGLGEISASWARITDGASPTTRVCAYDRAGQAWSDDVAEPQDGVTAARDLHARARSRPARKARTCWSGTPSAAPTR